MKGTQCCYGMDGSLVRFPQHKRKYLTQNELPDLDPQELWENHATKKDDSQPSIHYNKPKGGNKKLVQYQGWNKVRNHCEFQLKVELEYRRNPN